MKYNITKGGFDLNLGGPFHINSNDRKIGFSIGEHLSIDTDGKTSFRI